MNKEALAVCIADLKSLAQKIRELEAQAMAALYDRHDEETYRRRLAAKTDLLIALGDRIEDLPRCLPAGAAAEAAHLANAIITDAANAKRIGSIFYMYALLYPQGYEQGEPNELEEFIIFLETIKGENL